MRLQLYPNEAAIHPQFFPFHLNFCFSFSIFSIPQFFPFRHIFFHSASFFSIPPHFFPFRLIFSILPHFFLFFSNFSIPYNFVHSSLFFFITLQFFPLPLLLDSFCLCFRFVLLLIFPLPILLQYTVLPSFAHIYPSSSLYSVLLSLVTSIRFIHFSFAPSCLHLCSIGMQPSLYCGTTSCECINIFSVSSLYLLHCSSSHTIFFGFFRTLFFFLLGVLF